MNLLKRMFTRKPLTAAEPVLPAPKELRRILRPETAHTWLMPSLSSITPSYIEGILRGGLSGSHQQQWELFSLMEDTWPRLAKNLNEIKRTVVGMNWQIEPWSSEGEEPSDEARERMRLVSDALWRMDPDPATSDEDFDGLIYDVLDAWAKGLSVIELDWTIKDHETLGDITCPNASAWVHPRHYAWAEDGRLGLRTNPDQGIYTTSNQTVDEFPPHKFVIAKAKLKTASPTQWAMLRALAWWWCAMNFSSDWLLNLAQVFGLPFRWANYPQSASQDTVDKICTMLEEMGAAGWAALPEGTTMELKEPSRGGPGTSPQDNIMDRADKQCDLLILGQTLTSDVGDSGSRALGDVHMDVRTGNIQAAANFAAKVINKQVVPSILELNYGDRSEPPEFVPHFDTQEDATANANRDKVLIDAGVEIPKAWFYERHGIPMPQDGEEVIGGKKPIPAALQPFAEPGQPPGTANVPPGQDDDDPEDEEEMNAQNAAEALAADLTPVHERLERILAIRDDAILQARLRDFLQDLNGQLGEDLKADPRLAVVLQQLMTKSMEKGLKKQ